MKSKQRIGSTREKMLMDYFRELESRYTITIILKKEEE